MKDIYILYSYICWWPHGRRFLCGPVPLALPFSISLSVLEYRVFCTSRSPFFVSLDSCIHGLVNLEEYVPVSMSWKSHTVRRCVDLGHSKRVKSTELK
jgi:hypothetical protein